MLCAIAVTVFTVTAWAQSDENTFTIKVEDVSAQRGDTVKVKVSTNENSGFTYLKIELSYDKDAMTLLNVENGEVASDMLPGNYYIWTSNENSTKNAVLTTLEFKVASNAEYKQHQVQAKVIECSNYDEENVTVNEEVGSINVTQATSSRPTGGTTVYYPASSTKYTVTFNLYLGAIKTVKVIDGNKVEAIADPILNGYEFAGWYSDEKFSKKFDFSTPIKSSQSLWAKWIRLNEWTDPYEDVKSGNWFYESVKQATVWGLVNGMSVNSFVPDAPLTRAMLTTILYRIAGSPEVEAKASFEDVTLNSWYAKAVTWASDNGIVNGVGNGMFAPDAYITREQMATMLFRYAEFINASGDEVISLSKEYTDFDMVSSYALSAIKWAVGKGIMNGDSETTLSPASKATRAQAAALIVRFVGFIK